MMRAVASEPENAAAGGASAWSLTGVIARLRRVLRSSVRQEFPWESLPMAQVEVLQRLADEPGLGVSGLASRQRLAVNTVSNLVQQMVVSGLVERLTRPGDRRSVTLTLTGRGAAVLAAVERFVAARPEVELLSSRQRELRSDD